MTRQVSIAEACRRHGITKTTFARWREQALTAVEKALGDRGRRSGREAELVRDIPMFERRLGQMTMLADLRGNAGIGLGEAREITYGLP